MKPASGWFETRAANVSSSSSAILLGWAAQTSAQARRRVRGPAKHALWRRPEILFGAMHSIKRALQRDLRDRLRAYWRSPGRLQEDAAAWREELGADSRRPGAPRLP